MKPVKIICILHISDPHFQSETMVRISALASQQPSWDVVALTGDCAGVLPEEWNEWPQTLKLAVPGNHDSPDTFKHLTRWTSKTPWFLRHEDLAFLGIDTSDLSRPFRTLEEQLDAFWDENIDGVGAFVLLTHQWPLGEELADTGKLLSKFVDNRRLLVLDGHNHPRGTCWENSAKWGSITCYRSTVISCNAPKGSCQLLSWNTKGFACETVRGKYERPRRQTPNQVIFSRTSFDFSIEPRPTKETRDPWVKCKCGLSQKRSRKGCRFCGRSLGGL